MFKLRRKEKKLLIIGLDGVSHEMIIRLSQSGKMPQLNKILPQGHLAKMSASIPDISSVSWSSFMTGTDPGNHGIFGFTDLQPGGYKYHYPDFRDLALPPFFDRLGDFDRRSVIINLPSTYPARPIPGVLISGFVALDLKRAVTPVSYYPLLNEYGYQVDVDAVKGKDQKKEFLNDLHLNLQNQFKVADYLWSREKWDVFMFTVTGTDRLHHFLFDAFENESHPFHHDFIHYYQQIDKIIGDLFQRLENNENIEFIMLSDHGFGLLNYEINLTPIFKRAGLFSQDVPTSNSLEGISASSQIFILDPARIYIHLKGKYPRGAVDKHSYHSVCRDVVQLCDRLVIDGRKVISKVYLKEELYSKKLWHKAPDIILMAEDGFDLKAGLSRKEEYNLTHFTGMHRQSNAFYFSTLKDFPVDMTIFDVYQQIFDWMV